MKQPRVVLGVAVAVTFVLLISALAWRLASQTADFALRLPFGPACAVSSAASTAAGGGAGSAEAGSPTAAGPVSASPVLLDPVELDSEQMANAATIVALAIRRNLPARAPVVALATAYQESKIRNLESGDRDSIGLFQQRPSQGWGTPEQISDVRYATNAFYTKLVKVKGWQQMSVTDAAQRVQRSAYPEAYQQWATRAQVLATALSGKSAGTVACRSKQDPPLRGTAATGALTDLLRLDWGDVRVADTTGDTAALSLTVNDEAAGWRYAHWLVSHAAGQGVERVRYDRREWTAGRGTWADTNGDPGVERTRVTAVVYR